MNYYNEFDPKAAAWLRELVKAGLIPNGDVDERSIAEVKPSDLVGYTQCHFFAGIGGWPYALQLAGWSADRPVWTGSCPCQPFSTAGKGLGQADERHLWPVFFRLIKECRPDCVFGEQVEGAIGKGWLDGVQRDLEGEGYAVGHCVLGAHSVGSPHIRQRLYWVADACRDNGWAERRGAGEVGSTEQGEGCGGDSLMPAARSDGAVGGVADAKGRRHEGYDVQSLRRERATPGHEPYASRSSSVGGVANGQQQRLEGYSGDVHDRNKPGWKREDKAGPVAEGGAVGGVADNNNNNNKGLEGQDAGCRSRTGETATAGCGCVGGVGNAAGVGQCGGPSDGRGQPAEMPWARYETIACRDGKHRRIPVEPAFFPLADGVPARVVRLRGYGNAIVPQVAAAFVAAYLG